jgi:hypothetical protein
MRLLTILLSVMFGQLGWAQKPGRATSTKTAAPSPTASPTEEAISKEAPTTEEIIKTIYNNLDVPFVKQHVGCETVSYPAPKKIADYMIFLTKTLAESSPNNISAISAMCLPKGKTWPDFPRHPKEGTTWDCELMYSTVDREGSSPWYYGIRYRLRKPYKIDTRWIACPGVP